MRAKSLRAAIPHAQRNHVPSRMLVAAAVFGHVSRKVPDKAANRIQNRLRQSVSARLRKTRQSCGLPRLLLAVALPRLTAAALPLSYGWSAEVPWHRRSAIGAARGPRPAGRRPAAGPARTRGGLSAVPGGLG